MTKTLLVMRHGKSDQSAPGGDHERPLKMRGRRAARRVGRLVAESGLPVERVLASSAARARETARLALEASGLDAPLETRAELYLPSREAFVEELRSLGTEEGVLVVGHEPSCSSLVAYLSGGNAPAFPTAALACIELEIEAWADLEASCGSLAWLVTPKLLGP